MPKVSVQHLVEKSFFGDARENGAPSSDFNRKMACFEMKLLELNDSFVNSLMERGIVKPIGYDPYSDQVHNGHHRILFAWLMGIEYIEYTTDINGSFDSEWEGQLPNSR